MPLDLAGVEPVDLGGLRQAAVRGDVVGDRPARKTRAPSRAAALPIAPPPP
jgi:hypothetical protein